MTSQSSAPARATPVSEPAAAIPSGVALAVILAAQLMVVLDFSMVNVALPSITRAGTTSIMALYAFGLLFCLVLILSEQGRL